MAISLIDKIKQKNGAEFKLVDAIDVHGRITGWQNPVKKIFADVAAINLTGFTTNDPFIVQDTSGLWGQFFGKDIYGRDATAVDNGIYVLGESIAGEDFPIVLVTAPERGMVVLNLENKKLKYYDLSRMLWDDLVSSTGGVGKTLRFENVFDVDGSNYNKITKELTITETIQEGDSLKIWVNGIKYSSAGGDFSFTTGDDYITWNDANAGFDLEIGDEIIIENYQ